MDVKEAFEYVSLDSLSLVMKEMDSAPMLAGATLREQIGERYDICLQATRVSGIPLISQSNKVGKKAHLSST